MVMPNTVLLSAGGLSSSALARRALQYRTFPQSSGGGFPVAFVCCGAVRRLETAESGLNGGESRFGHKIAVRRYLPVGKFGLVVLVFSDEGTVHCGLPVLHLDTLRSSIPVRDNVTDNNCRISPDRAGNIIDEMPALPHRLP
jgi:hypothetical protein